MNRNKQQGFAHIVIIIAAVLLVGTVGVVSYRVISSSMDSTTESPSQTNEAEAESDDSHSSGGTMDEAAPVDSNDADTSDTPTQDTTTPTTDQPSTASPTPTTSPAPSGSGTSGGGSSGTSEPTVQKKSFTINSFNFGYSLSTMTVSPGDVVTVTLTNSGGNHDWVVNEISGAATAIISGGQTDSITFTVPQSAAGKSYKFYCSVGNHRAQGMVGDFIVSS